MSLYLFSRQNNFLFYQGMPVNDTSFNIFEGFFEIVVMIVGCTSGDYI